jgi:glycosyltransferase involved in cell wall biosynthesis
MTLSLVSVVIPAYNEENQIAGCLESVAAISHDGFEVIVVDDNSTDKTVEVASRYPVRVIRRSSRGGIAAARNSGLQAVRGEIVAFVDADCVVDKSWLQLLLSHYTDSRIAGVGGVVGTRDSSFLAKYRNYIAKEQYADSTGPVYGTPCIPGGNSSYRTNVLREIGGFDPASARPIGYEELELGYRLVKNGYLLVGEPRAVVWHLREGNLRNWISGAYASGYSTLHFLGRYRSRQFLGLQVWQSFLLAFLVFCVISLTGAIPLPLVIDVVIAFALVVTLRAVRRSFRAVVHYKNPRYVVMIPVELMLTFTLCLGYVVALLEALRCRALRIAGQMSGRLSHKSRIMST